MTNSTPLGEPDPTADKIAAAQAIVSDKASAEEPRKRRVRFGPLDDVHDVRHEAARSYRAIRSDPLRLKVAPHAISRLIILSDVFKTTDLEQQVWELREMLKSKANGAVRWSACGPFRASGVGFMNRPSSGKLKGEELQAFFANGNHEPHFRILNEAERDAKARKLRYRDLQEFCDCAEAVSSGIRKKQSGALTQILSAFPQVYNG